MSGSDVPALIRATLEQSQRDWWGREPALLWGFALVPGCVPVPRTPLAPGAAPILSVETIRGERFPLTRDRLRPLLLRDVWLHGETRAYVGGRADTGVGGDGFYVSDLYLALRYEAPEDDEEVDPVLGTGGSESGAPYQSVIVTISAALLPDPVVLLLEGPPTGWPL